MPAPEYNIAIEQGVNFQLDFSIDLNGVDLDVDTWTIDGCIKQTHGSNNYVPFTITKLDAATGSVRLALTPDQTGKIKKPSVYDVEITNEDGDQTIRILQGQVSVSGQVTNYN
jgi:hypothetical protein